jgi:hypothetical protein
LASFWFIERLTPASKKRPVNAGDVVNDAGDTDGIVRQTQFFSVQ